MIQIDKSKALKKWGPVLDNLKIQDDDKRNWMSEYAEYHMMNENVSYVNLGNIQGMNGIVPPIPSTTPGQAWTAGAGDYTSAAAGGVGSGDIAQNLLPVSMKIAAQTIGLDLVAVKPASSPRIELLFVDFKYDNNPDDIANQTERPLVFKLYDATNQATIRANLLALLTANSITENMGGLSSRIFVHLSGGTATWDTHYNLTTLAHTARTTEPTVAQGREGWLEFLGFSRVDGYPMFRAFKQVGTTSPNVPTWTAANNTFILDTNNMSTALSGATIEGLNTGFSFTTLTVQLVSTLEDQIPGFSAGWYMNNAMRRDEDERIYPGVIGPDLFTKSIQVGDIEISSALKRTQIEDIKASTGMDIVQKLESVLINELTQVISKQIVKKVKDLGVLNRASATCPTVAGVSKFDFNVDNYIGATGFGPAPGGETTHSIQRKLVAKINNASNFIATDGRVGPAQYLVTNGNLASALQDIAGYTINPVNAGKLNTNGQLYPMGNIGQIAIYVDPYMKWEDNWIYLGRKNSVEQPGLIFVPYLMAQSISLISEATWAPRMLIRSRYAIADIGFFPWKQFMAIEVTDTNGVLI
jgi:hypothetical protein